MSMLSAIAQLIPKAFERFFIVVDDLSSNADGTATASQLDGGDLDLELGRFYPLFARPPASAKGLVFKLGGLAIALSYCAPDHEPRDLEPGEAQLQTDSGAKIKMTKTGKVLVNGGGRGVARLNDSAACGTLSGTVLVAGVPVPVQFTYVPPGGGVFPAASTAHLSGLINSASNTIEGDA